MKWPNGFRLPLEGFPTLPTGHRARHAREFLITGGEDVEGVRERGHCESHWVEGTDGRGGAEVTRGISEGLGDMKPQNGGWEACHCVGKRPGEPSQRKRLQTNTGVFCFFVSFLSHVEREVTDCIVIHF